MFTPSKLDESTYQELLSEFKSKIKVGPFVEMDLINLGIGDVDILNQFGDRLVEEGYIPANDLTRLK